MAVTQINADKENGPNDLPSLKNIYFYLTEGCNLACRHCWIAPSYDPSGDRTNSLPVSLFETAIEEAKPLGLQGVKLTGGEPLMHPRFMELLDIVQREKLALNIETNGLLCTPEIAQSIARSPNRIISVSIDGANAETHEWIRGVPGSFEKAKNAVKNLVEASAQPQIIMTLMRCNVDQVEDVIKIAQNLGASSIKFNIMQPTARAKNLFGSGDSISIEHFLKVQKHVETHVAPSTKMDLQFSSPLAFHSLGEIAKRKFLGSCGIIGVIGVLASGHYALCGIGTSIQELVFGEVGKDCLADIWKDNGVLKDLRKGIPTQFTGICAKCLLKDLCMGYCVAQNYYNTGKIWTSYWFCSQADEEGIFPSGRLNETYIHKINNIMM